LTLSLFEARGIEVFSCPQCNGVLLPVSQALRVRTPRRPRPEGRDANPERSAENVLFAVDITGELIDVGFDAIVFLFPDLEATALPVVGSGGAV
jgi:hypothetical protein